jgi:hypothetical protein
VSLSALVAAGCSKCVPLRSRVWLHRPCGDLAWASFENRRSGPWRRRCIGALRAGGADQALRFALAFLSNFADERWPFDAFWRALSKEHQQGRWQAANAALNAIRLAVGGGASH